MSEKNIRKFIDLNDTEKIQRLANKIDQMIDTINFITTYYKTTDHPNTIKKLWE